MILNWYSVYFFAAWRSKFWLSYSLPYLDPHTKVVYLICTFALLALSFEVIPLPLLFPFSQIILRRMCVLFYLSCHIKSRRSQQWKSHHKPRRRCAYLQKTVKGGASFSCGCLPSQGIHMSLLPKGITVGVCLLPSCDPFQKQHALSTFTLRIGKVWSIAGNHHVLVSHGRLYPTCKCFRFTQRRQTESSHNWCLSLPWCRIRCLFSKASPSSVLSLSLLYIQVPNVGVSLHPMKRDLLTWSQQLYEPRLPLHELSLTRK